MTQRARTPLKRALLAALLAYWGFMVIMTHAPKPPPVGPQVSDKLAHFLAYGLLTGLLFLAAWGFWPRLKWLPGIVLALACSYAAVDELTQPLTGRAAEMGDWLADAAGALVAVLCLSALRAVYRWIRRDKPASPANGCTASMAAASPLP